MEINDTKDAFLSKNINLQKDKLHADINTSASSSGNVIVFSDEWSNVTNQFTNTKTEKIGEVTIADLIDTPKGLVFDEKKQTLTFVDDTLFQTDSDGCPFEDTNQVTLNELTADLDVLELLDRINNFGSIFDFQFRQIDYGNFKFANAKLCTSFANSIGFFSIDKLVNDEQIRRARTDFLNEKFADTDRAEEFPPYNGFLVDEEYINNGWISIDKVIHIAYNDEFAYDNESSLAIRTSRFNEAKRAWISFSLSYVSDIYRLNSFNKLSDFGLRVVDRTTGQELDTSYIIANLPGATSQSAIAHFSGKLDPFPEDNEESQLISNSIKESEEKNCKKINRNSCTGELFTASSNPNTQKETDGQIREFEPQIKINPVSLHREDRPDILNTVDAIHWTSGTQNLSDVAELKSLYNEFGKNTYTSGQLNVSRAFAYGNGEFDFGYVTGGYSHNEIDEETRLIEPPKVTERWNGLSWSVLTGSELPQERAIGLAGGNPEIGVISHGIKNTWSNPSFDNDFVPDGNELVDNLKTNIFFSNKWVESSDVTWLVDDDLTSPINRHSVAGALFIEYDQTEPGENLEPIYEDGNVTVCNEVSSQAQTFASSQIPEEGSPDFLIGNNDPRVWFDVWKVNGIAFCGKSGGHDPLNSLNGSEVTDQFEFISWSRVIKSSLVNGITTTAEANYGCWKIDPLRQYPLATIGTCYVGDVNSGLATGGKTAISINQDVESNAKINMWYAYASADQFDDELLAVTPVTYENTGITWFRRDDMPEAVYYHAGVGDAEHSVFWGGLHASLEEPQCFVSFENCEDWEQMVNEFAGAFTKNGMYTLDGNIRYASFATESDQYDGNPSGDPDSWGNTYYRTADVNDPSGLGVVYSEEYIKSENPTIHSEYPSLKSYEDWVQGEFIVPTKHIYTSRVVNINIDGKELSKRDSIPSLNFIQRELISLGYITDPDKVKRTETFDLPSFFIETSVLFEEQVKQYFSNINSKFIIKTVNPVDSTETANLNVNVFQNGESRVIQRNDFDQPFIEFGATDNFFDRNGEFTKYVGENSSNFNGTYNFVTNRNNAFGFGVFARRTNAKKNIDFRYSGHPSDGGMWLWSRPTAAEAYFHPDLFFKTRNQPTEDYISHGFGLGATPYTFYVNNAASNLDMVLTKDKNGEIKFVESWTRDRINVEPNDRELNFLARKKVDKNGVIRGVEENFFKLYEYGTSCVGSFLSVDTNLNPTKTHLIEKLIDAQFENATNESQKNLSGLDRWLNEINFTNKTLDKFEFYRPIMYDDFVKESGRIGGYFLENSQTLYSGGVYKSSVVRDRSLLFPWNDLLHGDPTNTPTKGDSTWRWDYEGNFYYAFVEDIVEIPFDEYRDPLGRENQTNFDIYRSRKPIIKETYRIQRYNKDGRLDFDYQLIYHNTPMELDISGRNSAIFNRVVNVEVDLSSVNNNVIIPSNDIQNLIELELITRAEDVRFDSLGPKYIIEVHVSPSYPNIATEIREYFRSQYGNNRVKNSDIQVGRVRASGDLFGTGIKSQRLIGNLYNSRHVYGSNQNFAGGESRTISNFNWEKVYERDYKIDPPTLSESYPYIDGDLCSMLDTYNLYVDDKRYQVYIEGHSFGNNSNNDLIKFTPATNGFSPVFKSFSENNIYDLPKQIHNDCGCGIRENLARLRYYEQCLAPHLGVVFGDIRSMGEDLEKCASIAKSIIARGDTPAYDVDVNGLPGQPEYYLECKTTIPWYSTGIATDFTATMHARFRRDALGLNSLDDYLFIRNKNNEYERYRTQYPTVYNGGGGPLYPFQVADPCNPDDIIEFGLPANGVGGSGNCNFPIISNASLDGIGQPNAVIFMGGIFDVIYDKNFYETIYFLEEMAKMAQAEKRLMVWTTIPPRPQMQFRTALYNNSFFKNLVGQGNIVNDRNAISNANNPINGDDVFFGDSWNAPISVDNPYEGLEDPFIGKTKLEKLVAINEWMKKTMPNYGQIVLDVYDFLVDKNRPAGDNRIGNNTITLIDNEVEVTFDEALSSDNYSIDIKILENVISQETEIIKSGNNFVAIVRYTTENEGEIVSSAWTFNVFDINNYGFKLKATDGFQGQIIWEVSSNDVKLKKYSWDPSTKNIQEQEGNIYGYISPEFSLGDFSNTPIAQNNGKISDAGQNALFSWITKQVDFNPFLDFKIIEFNANSQAVIVDGEIKTEAQLEGVNTEAISEWINKIPENRVILENNLIPTKCEPYLGECVKLDPLVHDFQVESTYFDLLCCLLNQETCVKCFAECTTSEDFSDLKYRWIQHNREQWSTPILESPLAGLFNDPDFNVWLTAGNIKDSRWGTNVWASIDEGEITIHYRRQRLAVSDKNANANRNHLYYATLTAEVKLSDIDESERVSPTPVRVYYDEFIFDKSAYEGTEFLTKIEREIERGQLTTLGYECADNACAYNPCDVNNLFGAITGFSACDTTNFAYSEWATNFVQEFKNQDTGTEDIDQNTGKYYLKYDVNRLTGSNTFIETPIIDENVEIVDTDWRRYQDGVGLGGDAPILNVANNDSLTCNALSEWYIGQTAFGKPNRAIIVGGWAINSDGSNNRSRSWWELLTTPLTFKWNKYVINPEDTFNKNYARRNFSTFFTNNEPTSTKSNFGVILYDLADNVLVERQGFAIFNGESSVDVLLDLEDEVANKDKYSIVLTPSDNINVWWTEKTAEGFTVNVDANNWTGRVDWQIVLNDRLTTEFIDDEKRGQKTYDEFEGI